MPNIIKEIESKYRLSEKDKIKVLNRLKTLNARLMKVTKEIDTYYTRADIDFMKTQECLRIRQTADYSELTYKPGTTIEMEAEHRYWKKEVNIAINGQEKKINELLTDLGCKQLVTVEKNRDIYSLERNIFVFIDHIEHLGWFIEIEVLSNNKSSGLEKLKNIEVLLGLSENDLILEPYRDLLMKELGLISKQFKAHAS